MTECVVSGSSYMTFMFFYSGQFPASLSHIRSITILTKNLIYHIFMVLHREPVFMWSNNVPKFVYTIVRKRGL